MPFLFVFKEKGFTLAKIAQKERIIKKYPVFVSI
jgi:hypothetical protein